MIRTLHALGYNDKLNSFRKENELETYEIGRVISEHKERYTVMTESGEFEAEITGNLRFNAQNREEFPATGDWVSLSVSESGTSIIHDIFPRYSILSRPAVGKYGSIQIIATNIDFALIVQAIDRDYNMNRIERYLTICHSSNVSPIIVLTKIDLIDQSQIDELVDGIKKRINNIAIVTISNKTQEGYVSLWNVIEEGKTYCLLGSSGVGKSTILNNLSGRAIMKTDSISSSTSKGRHITSHRELIVLEKGGILIDNPGMREVGVYDTSNGMETTFNDILTYSKNCKFKDCTHTVEVGCSVLDAVSNKIINENSFKNYLKIEKERAYFDLSIQERRRKDKTFGKMIKHYKKNM